MSEGSQLITWGFSGLSLLVTVVWNLQNRWHTNTQAKKIRAETFKFSTWKDLRDPVLSRLREFENKGHEIQLLASRENDLSKLAERIHDVGYAMTHAQLALSKDLKRLRSDRLTADQWAALAYGPTLAGDSAWDRIMTLIDEAANATTIDDARIKLRKVPLLIDDISKALNEAIAVENTTHDPDKI